MNDKDAILERLDLMEDRLLAAIEGERQQVSVTGDQMVAEIKQCRAHLAMLLAKYERFTKL